MTINSKFRRSLLGAMIALISLSGCETFNAAESSMQVDAAEARVTMDRFVERPGPLREPDTVQTVDGIWLGNNSTRISKGDPLPKSTDMVTLISAEPLGLQDIATEVTTLTGLPVILDTEQDALGGGDQAAAPNLDGGFGGGFDNAGADSGATGGSFVAPSTDTIQLSYSGPLGGLLDLLATRFNIAWEYRNGSIRFFENETKVFTLYALAAQLQTTSNVGTGSTGDADTGGFSLSSGISASQSIAVDLFNEIVSQVSDLVSASGGSVTASPASGTISVTGRPHVLDRVSDFVDDQNERLSRQIALYVQVVSVELSKSDALNFDLGIFFDNLVQFTTQTPGQIVGDTAAGAISAVVLEPATPGKDPIRDDLAGSSLAFNAIATKQKASLINSANLITMNGIPVPFQSVNQTRFISQVSEETDPNTGSTTTTAELEDLITGFSLSLTPRIIADGGVMLQYAINLSELNSLETTPTGGGSEASFVQIPNIDITSFVQQAVLRSDQTLALAGFEGASNNTTETGQGLPENIALGGGKTGDVKRNVVIVLITPKIIDSRQLLRGSLL